MKKLRSRGRNAAPWRFGVPEALWALFLGAISGTAAALLREIFRWLQWLFTQNTASLPSAADALSPWRRVVTPVAGALLATAVLALQRRFAARKLRPFVEYVRAVRLEHGKIPLTPNLWRTASSSFSVASGAAIGREGSMIQFAAAVTSATARAVRGRWPRLEAFPAPLGVACGVAGGVATAYGAPIAAIFFALEIVLGEFSLEEILPVAFASLAGWLVSRGLLGSGNLYSVHLSFAVTFPEVGWMLLLVLALGAFGPVYQRIVGCFAAARRLPLPLVWAGLAVGVLSLLDPRVWGNGDAGLDAALGRAHPLTGTLQPLAVLLLLRLLATAISTGTGTVGGVFTPTLFVGASLGFLSARLLHVHDPVFFAVLGMACLIAAATHAPFMAAFIAVELTGDWRLLPFLLTGCLISWQIARRLSREALYAIASSHPTDQGLPGPHEEAD